MTPRLSSDVLGRFLRYLTYDTQSREDSTTCPSTPGQLVLLQDLVTELHALGIADAVMDAHGYVMATIPATTAKADVPARPTRSTAAGAASWSSRASRPTRSR
jgi:tripeptide aminopeptidase